MVKRYAAGVIIVFGLFILVYFSIRATRIPSDFVDSDLFSRANDTFQDYPKTEALVLHVIDGDTIEVSVDGHKERVRLIGVDAPELEHRDRQGQHYSQESRQFTVQQLQNEEIILMRDRLCSDRDQYHRLLRYVYHEDTLFNARIIESGYAYAYCAFPFGRKDEFLRLEAMAREQGRGIWNCRSPGHTLFSNNSDYGETPPDKVEALGVENWEFAASRRSRVFHHIDCPAVKDISPRNLLYFKTEREARSSGRRPCKICGGMKSP